MFKDIILYIIIIILLIVGYIKYIENRGVFFPIKNIEITPDFINLPFEDIYIQTKDNIKINGWFISSNNAKYTILFCHGNAGNIADRLDKISLLYGLGVNIFIIDYRGFGRSQGRPSESGLYLDAEAAYNYLVNIKKILAQQIILYGESLGTVAVINLAAKLKVKAIILEGAFSSGKDMARKIYPFLPTFLFSNKFDSQFAIREIGAPKLFIHSRDDEIVPFNLARKLYDVSREPKQFIEIQGDHNNAFLDSKETYISSIAAFIRGL